MAYYTCIVDADRADHAVLPDDVFHESRYGISIFEHAIVSLHSVISPMSGFNDFTYRNSYTDSSL